MHKWGPGKMKYALLFKIEVFWSFAYIIFAWNYQNGTSCSQIGLLLSALSLSHSLTLLAFLFSFLLISSLSLALFLSWPPLSHSLMVFSLSLCCSLISRSLASDTQSRSPLSDEPTATLRWLATKDLENDPCE